MAREHWPGPADRPGESDRDPASVRALRPDLLRAGRPAPRRSTGSCGSGAPTPAYRPSCGSPASPSPLPPETELALLRAAQEALTNIGRHAAASRAVVSLSYLGDTVTLDIDDDGVGFAGPAATRRRTAASA